MRPERAEKSGLIAGAFVFPAHLKSAHSPAAHRATISTIKKRMGFS
jgi:hypothetical protein